MKNIVKSRKKHRELNQKQLQIREKVIIYTIKYYKSDYSLSDQEIAEIFGISRQALYKMKIRNRINK
jgi:predicted DNA-binding protein YlxM (UPF0122 family)